MIAAGLTGDPDGIAAAMDGLGFIGSETRPTHRKQLLRMVDMVFTGKRRDPAFDFSETDLPHQIRERGLALAKDGVLPPPMPIDVLHTQRRLRGMYMLAARLGARVAILDLVHVRLAEGPGDAFCTACHAGESSSETETPLQPSIATALRLSV